MFGVKETVVDLSSSSEKWWNTEAHLAYLLLQLDSSPEKLYLSTWSSSSLSPSGSSSSPPETYKPMTKPKIISRIINIEIQGRFDYKLFWVFDLDEEMKCLMIWLFFWIFQNLQKKRSEDLDSQLWTPPFSYGLHPCVKPSSRYKGTVFKSLLDLH